MFEQPQFRSPLPDRLNVFISYSYEDEAFRRKLEDHLTFLERQGAISVWHAGRLAAGMNRNQETEKYLTQATVFLILMSPNYLAADYTYGVELPRIWERHEREGAVVVPIIVRPCAWRDTELGNIEPLPTKGRPVANWETQDAAFNDIVSGLRKVFDDIRAQPYATSQKGHSENTEQALPQTQPHTSGTQAPPNDADVFVAVQGDAPSAVTSGQTESLASAVTGTTPKQTSATPQATESVVQPSPPITKEAQPDALKVTSDRAVRTVDEDQLGFDIWVSALHQFITSPETTTPLTIGIDGPWGTGKTSFMYMLQNMLECREPRRSFRWLLQFLLTYPVWLTGKSRVRLESQHASEITDGLSYDPDFDTPIDNLRAENPNLSARQLYWAKIAAKHCPRTPRNNPTIWFDAWKFEQEEQIWAALALAVLDQIKQKYNHLSRLDFWCRLAFKRFAWPIALYTVVLKFLLPIVLAVIAWQFNVFIQVATKAYPSSLETLLALQPLAQGVLGIGAVISGLLQVNSIVSNPFQIPIKQIFDRPNYEEKVGFISGFEADFAHIVSVITRPRLGWKARKLVIFIDDLDRCKPPKAVDIIEAINLFLGSEQCVFVMGVDTVTVVASVETKYKELFDQMHKGRAKRISEGHFFLEKIIQVPLRIPPVTEHGITRLIEGITAQGNRPLHLPSRSAAVLKVSSIRQYTSTDLSSRLRSLPAPSNSASYSRQEVREAIQLGAQLVRSNPRQVKRFVNLFRLSICVLNAQQLFEEQNNVGLTMQRLAVWIAWSVRWGELARYLIEEMPLSRNGGPDLLDLLAEVAACIGDDWEWSANAGMQPNLVLLDKVYSRRDSSGSTPSYWCALPWERWLDEAGFRRCIKELEMFWSPPPSGIDWLQTLLLMTRITLSAPVLSASSNGSLP